MLTIIRRHSASCIHKRSQHDQKWLKCNCPLHVLGNLKRGQPWLRQSVNTRDYREAVRLVRAAEDRGYWDKPSGNGAQGPKKLSAAIEAFLQDAASPNGRALRPQSHSKYVSLLNRFLDFVGDIPLTAIEPDMIRRFKDSWKMGARSAAGNMLKIRCLCRFMVDNEWLDRSPALGVRVPKPGKDEDLQKQPFSEEETTRILQSAVSLFSEGSDIEVAILVMRYAGLRISDAVMLRAESLKGDTLSVKTIKSGAKVTVPLPEFVIQKLNGIEPVNGYYFARGSARMQTQTDLLRRKFNKAAQHAGVSKATPHRLRHQYAVSALLAGLSTDTVSKMLGHSSPAITAKYYSAFTREREKALVEQVRQLWQPPKAA